MKRFLSSTATFAAPTETGSNEPKQDQAKGNLGDRLTARAIELASVDAPDMVAAMTVIAKAKEDWQGGPVKIMIAASKDYSDEQLGEFPDPDVKTGNNPVEWKWKPTKDSKEKTMNFYNVFADNLPPAKAIQQEIEWINALNNDKMDQTKVPEDYKNKYPNVDKRDQRKKYLSGRQGNFRAAIKAGFKLFFKLDAVNSLEGVEASVVPGANEGEYENLIHVNTTVEGRQTIDYENMSLTAFSKLDVNKAKENGGTYAALIATKKREQPDDQAGGSDAKPHLIRTLDTFKARVTDIHEFMDGVWSSKDKAQYTELLKTLGPRGPAGSDQFALTTYQVYTMLSDVYKHDAIRARAEKLKEEDATAEQPMQKAS